MDTILKKRIRLSKAARMMGCSTDTLLRRQTFQIYKLNPNSKTSPWMCYEEEVLAHLDNIDSKIERIKNLREMMYRPHGYSDVYAAGRIAALDDVIAILREN